MMVGCLPGMNAPIIRVISYRDKRLDERILSERMGREMRILAKGIESGINFPIILDYNSDRKEIVLQKIEGTMFNAVLQNRDNLTTNISNLAHEIAKMHSSNISHGDLNLNNIIVSGDQIFILDPSLGSLSPGVEEFATDIKMVNDFLAGYREMRILAKGIESGINFPIIFDHEYLFLTSISLRTVKTSCHR